MSFELAEREGLEPSHRVTPAYKFSKLAPSPTWVPLQIIVKKMELVEGIEPTITRLQITCLTVRPHQHNGGPRETRTLDFNLARVALSQLSYGPILANRRVPAYQGSLLFIWWSGTKAICVQFTTAVRLSDCCNR